MHVLRWAAFCPLCKHEEFLGDVCEGHALPVDLFHRVQAAVTAGGGAAPAPAPAPAPQTSWPELVGQSGADAVAVITASRPDLTQVVAMEEGGMMTMDWREDRVRVMVDAAGIVTQPPSVG